MTTMTIKVEEMATHSSILARRIPWTEEPGWLLVHGITSRLLGEISPAISPEISLRYTDDTTLMAKSKEELKNF